MFALAALLCAGCDSGADASAGSPFQCVGLPTATCERMLSEGRECRDVVTQISAATKALEQAGFKLIAAGLTYCVERPDEAGADGYSREDVERMFLKLA